MNEFKFEQFVEHWAQIYMPMQHVPGAKSKNKRFFFTDTYMGLSDFMASFTSKTSPCVVMESGHEGMLVRGLDQPRYTLYFLVKADDSQDGFAARAAADQAKEHMMDFVVYLKKKSETMKELQHIDAERIAYQTIGPLYNSWYGVYITIEDTRQYTLCVSKDKYSDKLAEK